MMLMMLLMMLMMLLMMMMMMILTWCDVISSLGSLPALIWDPINNARAWHFNIDTLDIMSQCVLCTQI